MAFQLQKMYEISTHTPLARRDSSASRYGAELAFLLTRLLRGVT